MNQAEQHLAKWVEQHDRKILLFFAVAALLLGLAAVRIEVAPGLDQLLLDSDPELLRNDEVKLDFSNDEILVIGYDLEGRPIDAELLSLLAGVRARLEGVAGVDEVIDLTNVEDIRPEAQDPSFIDASPLIGAAGAGSDALAAVDLEALRRRISNHPLYTGSLVSEDLSAVATVILPMVLDRADQRSEEVLAESRRVAGGNQAYSFATQAELNRHLVRETYRILADVDLKTWVAGYPAAEWESTSIVLRDLVVLTAVALLLVATLLWLLVRRWWAIGLWLSVVVWTELAAIAWLAVTGRHLNIVLSTLPTILLATSSTYALYLINLLATVDRNRDPGVGLIERCARSCLLSTLSTGAGFLALLLMPVPSIRELGAALTVGICACLGASLLLVPALVQHFDLRLESLPWPKLARFTDRGVRWARRPWRTLAAATPLIGLALAGLAQLQIESDPLTFWKEGHYHRRSDRFLHEHLGGSLFLQAVLSTGAEEGALRPEVLRFARDWLVEAEASPIVARSLSLLDYLALVDDVLDPEQERRYFEAPGMASQYVVLYENSGDADDLRHYIDFDRSALNLVLRVNSRSSSDILRLRDQLLAFAEGRPKGSNAEVLGTWLLFPKAMDGIARGMIQGLFAAFAAIFVALATFLRSWQLALIAMVPNTLPVLVCLGLLGWLGIPLSFATAIVGCVALGLAVDDTAHVLGHLEPSHSMTEASAPSGDVTLDLEQVYQRVGRALLVTTMTLGAGFLALTLSGFLPLVHFGIATALSLLVAFAADIFLLPSLLVVSGFCHSDHADTSSPVARQAEATPT